MVFSWFFPTATNCKWCRRRRVARGFFCIECLEQLTSWQEQYHPCTYCGRLIPRGGYRVCRQCQRERPVFQLARSFGPYRGMLREMVRALKYRGRRSLAEPMGQFMAGVVIGEPEYGRPDLLVPVPLTQTRLKGRGFNQAEILADALGRQICLPTVPRGILVRAKTTVPQVNLTRNHRWVNLAGAFVVKKPEVIKGKHVLLVDDVLTTGATASACAKSLLTAGADKVTVITLATGIENLHVISS